MTHLHKWQDFILFVTWPIHMRGMTYSHVWHDMYDRLIRICTVTPNKILLEFRVPYMYEREIINVY